jgi:uncharacterized protein (DUF427 family)
MTPVAVWNRVLLAESDETIIVEGNQYFPFDSLQLTPMVGASYRPFLS